MSTQLGDGYVVKGYGRNPQSHFLGLRQYRRADPSLPPASPSILDKQSRRSYIIDRGVPPGGITRRLAYEAWIEGCPCKECGAPQGRRNR
jgi:hypothetical protein